MTSSLKHGLTNVGEVRLHHVELGDGDPVVLLHGFPEFWYSWRRQLPVLAGAGFRAVAPDLRGYNESDKPAGIAAYRMRRLVGDIAGLIRSVGSPCHLVGHDWGGMIAWRLAAIHPELVRTLVVLNAPHPAVLRETLATSLKQRLRSAYVLFFQLPWLPEMYFRARDFAMLDQVFRSDALHKDAFSQEDVEQYKRAFRRPGGVTGPLNYYRAAGRFQRDFYGPPQSIRRPTLLLWGERDRYLGSELVDGVERWVQDLRIVKIGNASHWVQNDVPDRVNRLLIDFFKK